MKRRHIENGQPVDLDALNAADKQKRMQDAAAEIAAICKRYNVELLPEWHRVGKDEAFVVQIKAN